MAKFRKLPKRLTELTDNKMDTAEDTTVLPMKETLLCSRARSISLVTDVSESSEPDVTFPLTEVAFQGVSNDRTPEFNSSRTPLHSPKQSQKPPLRRLNPSEAYSSYPPCGSSSARDKPKRYKRRRIKELFGYRKEKIGSE
jgi:hypothetical protein